MCNEVSRLVIHAEHLGLNTIHRGVPDERKHIELAVWNFPVLLIPTMDECWPISQPKRRNVLFEYGSTLWLIMNWDFACSETSLMSNPKNRAIAGRVSWIYIAIILMCNSLLVFSPNRIEMVLMESFHRFISYPLVRWLHRVPVGDWLQEGHPRWVWLQHEATGDVPSGSEQREILLLLFQIGYSPPALLGLVAQVRHFNFGPLLSVCVFVLSTLDGMVFDSGLDSSRDSAIELWLGG